MLRQASAYMRGVHLPKAVAQAGPLCIHCRGQLQKAIGADDAGPLGTKRRHCLTG